jgi:UDP-3-O-[3-hydroxymyristoyl] glucosamine N-acyltransferase
LQSFQESHMAEITVAELAASVGGKVIGDGTRVVKACNTLMDATPDQVSLMHIAKYARELETTRAGCVVMGAGAAANVKRGEGLPPLTVIEAKNPYYAWQQTMVRLHGQRKHVVAGISQKAVIHPTAVLGKGVSVHPFAVIGEGVVVGDNVHIFSHVTLMHDVRIGNDTVLYPGVTVYEGSVIGNRCLINAGTVIGSDGFAYAQADGMHHKMPQTGGLVIEDDVEIGCASIVERGALKSTVVEKGSKIGSHVIIGHNCRIGAANVIISGTCISGSTTTGKYVVMGGQVGIAGHLDIPDFVKIGAQSGVMSNPEPNTEVVGTPAIEANRMKRIILQQMQLPELAKRVKELEKAMGTDKLATKDTQDTK